MPQSPYAPSSTLSSSISNRLATSSTAAMSEGTFEASLAFMAAIGLFLSVLVSDVFLVMDLCCGGLQVDDSIVPSPLSLLELSWTQMLMLYVLASTIVVACGVILMRNELPKSAIVMQMVPAILLVILAGYGLRKAGSLKRYVAYLYLVVGSILSGMALMYFINTGMSLDEYAATPVVYSFCLQGGLILTIAAALAIEQ